MSVTLVFILIFCFIITGLFATNQWKHYRIRRTGTLVTARVTQVSYWQDSLTSDVSVQAKMLPLFGERWEYELVAEWTDPRTEETHTLTSGRKRGLPSYQRGDTLSAYISPVGNYLVF
jgi:hypothetical protein